MSQNTILLDTPQMPHHTDLARVLTAFGGLQQRYNWLLSGTGGGPIWMSGAEFTEMVESGHSLYDWGVFSGFEQHVAVDPSTERVPFADGNPSFWRPYPCPQHPLAAVEIVCFEASLTLLLSREPEFTRRFRAHFTDARDLDRHIDEHVRPVLEAWAHAERTFPPGSVVTVPVVSIGQTTASVKLAEDVYAPLHVKQMRAAGFGPAHWFALNDHMVAGQPVTVRVVSLSAASLTAEAEFLRLATAAAAAASPAAPPG